MHIADVRKVALALKGDTVHYPGEILKALAIKPFAGPLPVQNYGART